MKKLLPLILILAAPSLAFAQQAPYSNSVLFDNQLSAVALNASAGTRTITLNNYLGGVPKAQFGKARIGIGYTYSAATTVTALFSCSKDGTNYHSVTSRTISGSTATVAVMTDTYTTGGASATIDIEYDIRGCIGVKWVFGGASAGAGDLVTVDVALVTGG